MIAVPITAESIDSALSDIGLANEKADIIELRLDFLEDVSESGLKELLDACEKPAIVTFRDKNFGASVEQTERVFMLKKAIDFGAHFVDIDFDSEKDFVEDVVEHKQGANIILSHHNFEETPSLPELMKVLNSLLEVPGIDVVKIVTFAQDESDNDTVLALIKVVQDAERHIIAFCMGSKGRKSRIACVKLGSLLTFASLGLGKESASGQLAVNEMRKELAK